MDILVRCPTILRSSCNGAAVWLGHETSVRPKVATYRFSAFRYNRLDNAVRQDMLCRRHKSGSPFLREPISLLV